MRLGHVKHAPIVQQCKLRQSPAEAGLYTAVHLRTVCLHYTYHSYTSDSQFVYVILLECCFQISTVVQHSYLIYSCRNTYIHTQPLCAIPCLALGHSATVIMVLHRYAARFPNDPQQTCNPCLITTQYTFSIFENRATRAFIDIDTHGLHKLSVQEHIK